jgi:uncharacterized repeat protein (TIGR01451 family)
MGSSMDGIAEDGLDIGYLRLFYVDLVMASTAPTVAAGYEITYTINYTIENSSNLINPIPATSATITSTVPDGTTYVSHTGGQSQSGPTNGVVMWTLASPITPTVSSEATGVVTLVVEVDSPVSTIENEAFMHIDEGLCDTDSETDYPTYVSLDSFTADWDQDRVLVEWSTAMEINTRGFNVWRSSSASGGYVKANDALIPSASPGGLTGGAYTFTDPNVVPGTTYYYKLEEIEAVGGARNWYGPVSTDGGSNPNAVTLSAVNAALAWWPAAAVAIAGGGLTALVVLRRRRQR